MDSLNRRLAEPPSVDVAAFRLMGLAVVGRLASRYGIRVELRANIEGGTVAQVILPSTHRGAAATGRSSRRAAAGMPQLDSGPTGWRRDAAGRARGDRDAAGHRARAVARRRLTGRPAPAGPPGSTRCCRQLPSQPSAAAARCRRRRTGRRCRPRAARRRTGRRCRPGSAAGRPRPPSRRLRRLGSPTVAYPTHAAAAPPELQVRGRLRHPRRREDPAAAASGQPEPVRLGRRARRDAARRRRRRRPRRPRSAPRRRSSCEMQASWFKGHDGADPGGVEHADRGLRPAAEPGQRPTPGAAAPRRRPPRRPPRPRRRPPAPRRRRPGSRAAPPARGSGRTGARAVSDRQRRFRAEWVATGGRPVRTAVARRCPGRARRPRIAGGPPPTKDGSGRWQRRNPPTPAPPVPDCPSGYPRHSSCPAACRPAPRNQNRRSPDEVRGLLSAYHRGVQRGRTAGSAEAAAGAPAPKENEQ